MRVVFLDRDGVINHDRDDYVKNTRELRVFPYVPDAIRRLNQAGIDVYVISNQQGIAKGVVLEDDLRKIEEEIVRQVEAVGGRISGFYYCKHLSSEKCLCRKPQPGMLRTASKDHGIDLNTSIMIGDSERDLMAAKNAGCRAVLVLSGAVKSDDLEHLPCAPDFVARDLAEAVDYVLDPEAKQKAGCV